MPLPCHPSLPRFSRQSKFFFFFTVGALRSCLLFYALNSILFTSKILLCTRGYQDIGVYHIEISSNYVQPNGCTTTTLFPEDLREHRNIVAVSK